MRLTFPKAKRRCSKHAFCITGTLLFSSIAFNVNGQVETHKNLIGVGSSLQWANGLGIQTAFSINYERKFTMHSSIETGLRYSPYRKSLGTFNYSSKRWENADGNYHYFSLPLLYKYSSNILNVAAGPTLNLMNGKPPQGYVGNPFQKDLKEMALGYQVKVGKTFNLTNKLVLEPEISVFGSEYFKKPLGEVNVGFKYRF